MSNTDPFAADPFANPVTPEPSALPAPALGEQVVEAPTGLPQYGQYATAYPEVTLPPAPQMPQSPYAHQERLGARTNPIATVALVLSLLSVTLPALICGIIGLNRAKERGGIGRTQSIAAIIISVVWLVIGFVLVALINSGNLTV